jgi:hypothetical protein
MAPTRPPCIDAFEHHSPPGDSDDLTFLAGEQHPFPELNHGRGGVRGLDGFHLIARRR